VTLELPDRQHWQAAIGYVELDMYLDAGAELDKIDPLSRVAPEVLAVRLEIYAGLQKWELMQAIAQRLTEYDPKNVQSWISLGYATRRAQSIEAARSILIQALKSHPEEPMISYNLACYECQLGNLPAAKQYLMRATKADAKFKLMALDDSDLEPLWTEIERIEV
jgi:tetratricopeptide (TPR) repeat protein